MGLTAWRCCSLQQQRELVEEEKTNKQPSTSRETLLQLLTTGAQRELAH